MDAITLQRIKTAHPDIREELEQQYKEANNLLGKGVRLRFAYVYRTIEEQNALFKQRPKVTNAKGGQSIHNYGLAFDIVLLYDLDNNGTFETASWNLLKDHDKDGQADWMEVVNYFKGKGWEHGGDWAKFKDYPHFQLKKKDGTSYTWQYLKKLIDDKKYILDNGIKYPII